MAVSNVINPFAKMAEINTFSYLLLKIPFVYIVCTSWRQTLHFVFLVIGDNRAFRKHLSGHKTNAQSLSKQPRDFATPECPRKGFYSCLQ